MAWGDKNNQGPWGRPTGSGGGQPPKAPPPPGGGPDFDEWLEKLRAQLKKLFPGGSDDNARLVIAAAVIGGLLWLASGLYFVRADEQGVVLRFGKFERTTTSGINYHWPYPIETVETPKVTAIRRAEIGFRSGLLRARGDADVAEESLMLTGDENIVDINFEVQWKISDAPDFLFNVRSQDETVKAVAESAMREVIGETPIATVLAEGKLQVEQGAKKLIQETLDAYKAGIEVVSVNLLKADPPLQVIDAFRDVQTARADLETARNQADAYRNDILPRARGQSQQIVLDAEGYRQEVIARAEGEASRFSAVYEQYKDARDVTRKRMYIEAMEDILQGMNKMIVEGKTGGVLPYLPLPELKPAAGNSEEKK